MSVQFVFVSCWFQIGWLLAVLGQNEWQFGLWLMVCATYIVWFYQDKISVRRAMVLALTGVLFDSVNTGSGLFQFTDFPFWLIALWLLFIWYAKFLLVLLAKLSLPVLCLCGAVGGASSYWGGYALGAVQFSLSPIITLCIVALEWSVITLIIKRGFYEK